jgi:hypothetical protein
VGKADDACRPPAGFGGIEADPGDFHFGTHFRTQAAFRDDLDPANWRVVSRFPIEHAPFRTQGDAVVRTAALIKASSWDRGSLIEKSGFATMPGSTTADSGVARACADILATSESKR